MSGRSAGKWKKKNGIKEVPFNLSLVFQFHTRDTPPGTWNVCVPGGQLSSLMRSLSRRSSFFGGPAPTSFFFCCLFLFFFLFFGEKKNGGDDGGNQSRHLDLSLVSKEKWSVKQTETEQQQQQRNWNAHACVFQVLPEKKIARMKIHYGLIVSQTYGRLLWRLNLSFYRLIAGTRVFQVASCVAGNALVKRRGDFFLFFSLFFFLLIFGLFFFFF